MKFTRIATVVFLFLVTSLLVSCTGSSRKVELGIHNAQLMPCPSSPNCVSSDSADSEHKTAPFQLAISAAEAWQVTRSIVEKTPRTKIITATADYLHAECRSAVFGFVDDLELHLRPIENVIAVRSAARVGYSDFGVNQQRIEGLRSALSEIDVVR